MIPPSINMIIYAVLTDTSIRSSISPASCPGWRWPG
ncbi:MAG: hypothetical protein M5U08_14015 [Burkholderiales bacterium]|nr:hypothetical protein [Burkholderiales bacterium]